MLLFALATHEIMQAYAMDDFKVIVALVDARSGFMLGLVPGPSIEAVGEQLVLQAISTLDKWFGTRAASLQMQDCTERLPESVAAARWRLLQHFGAHAPSSCSTGQACAGKTGPCQTDMALLSHIEINEGSCAIVARVWNDSPWPSRPSALRGMQALWAPATGLESETPLQAMQAHIAHAMGTEPAPSAP